MKQPYQEETQKDTVDLLVQSRKAVQGWEVCSERGQRREGEEIA